MSETKTTLEDRVFEVVQQQMGEEIAPTQIGVRLGYSYASASSRVASALSALRDAGRVVRTIHGHNRVTYRV